MSLSAFWFYKMIATVAKHIRSLPDSGKEKTRRD
jgi:hypothetical protein